MNKLVKREFLTVKEGESRKRWYITMICGRCGVETTLQEIPVKKQLEVPCVRCRLQIRAYHSFIQKSRERHQDRFDYSEVTEDNYKTCFDEVTILCKQHGKFQQKPKDHINKLNGKLCCPECIREFNKVHNKRSLESWVEELKAKAPHISMISQGNSDSNTELCELFCEYHGSFTAILASIKKNMFICGLCAQDHNSWGGRFRRTDVAGVLYFIHLPDHNLYKLGVTSKTVEHRLRVLGTPYKVLWEKSFDTLKEAYEAETKLFREYRDFRRGRDLPPILGKAKGNTEIMTCYIPITAIQ